MPFCVIDISHCQPLHPQPLFQPLHSTVCRSAAAIVQVPLFYIGFVCSSVLSLGECATFLDYVDFALHIWIASMNFTSYILAIELVYRNKIKLLGHFETVLNTGLGPRVCRMADISCIREENCAQIVGT